jgi:hypothetical protein
MAAAPTADELFLRATQFPLIICRRCEHAVRPKQVLYHLTHSQHRIPIAVARQIRQTIDDWDDIEENPMSFGIPRGLISQSRAYAFTTMVFYASEAGVAMCASVSCSTMPRPPHNPIWVEGSDPEPNPDPILGPQ